MRLGRASLTLAFLAVIGLCVAGAASSAGTTTTTTPELLMWFKGTGSTSVFGGNKGVGGAAHHPYYGIPVHCPVTCTSNPASAPDLGYHTYIYYGVRMDATFSGTNPTSSTHGYIKAGYITSKDFWDREYPLQNGYLNCISPGGTADGLLVEWRVAGQTTRQCAFAAKDDHLGTPLIQIVKDGSGWKVYYADAYDEGGYSNLAVQFGGQVFSTGFTDTTAAAGVFAGAILTETNRLPDIDDGSDGQWSECGGTRPELGYPHTGDGQNLVEEGAVRVRRGGGNGQWQIVVDGQMIDPAVAVGFPFPTSGYGSYFSYTQDNPGSGAQFDLWSGVACPSDPPPPTQCSNGLDDDGDSKIDLSDPGCENAQDNTEAPDSLQPPIVTTTSLSGGIVGQPYLQLVTATGGTAPYIWTVTAGTLPPGLSLTRDQTPSATMSGTPVLAGTFTFTVQVADSAAPFQAGTQDISITVGPAVPPAVDPSPLDDFDRPSEQPVVQGGNWDTTGINGGPGAPLAQNTLRNFPAPSGGFSYRVTPYFGGDMEAAVTVTTRPSSNDWVSVFVCLQDAGTAAWDGYELRAKVTGGPDLWEIRRVVNGSHGVIGSTNFEITAGGTMLLRRLDDALQLWWKPAGGAWTQKLAASDTNYRWGMIGVGGYRTGVLDNFGGGSLLSLIEQYVPELRPALVDTFRASSAAMMTDNNQPTYSNTLNAPSVGFLAQANPDLPEDNLSLYYLDRFYPPGGIAQGRESTADDYINAENSYDADAQRLQAHPIYANRTYARVFAGPNGTSVIQYWFFYYFNWHPTPTDLGDHEGDWEMAQVELDARGRPGRVTYSQHGGGEQCDWSLAHHTADGRLAVYVATGSHASYFREGSKPSSYVGPGDAPAGDEVWWTDAATTPSVEEIDPIAPGWLNWAGRWGASTSGDYQSPYGPAGQGQKWTDPYAWADARKACWEASTARRTGEQDAESAAVRPPAPKITATRVGRRVRVTYAFPAWPAGDRRPATLVTAIQPREDRFAPLGHRYHLTTRKGTFMRPLGLGTGPFTLVASAYSQTGRSSALVRARVRVS